MNIGDTIIYNEIEYTVWLIEGNVAHLLDSSGNGICITIN